ncbi:MAG: NAD(P)-dependent oxidoreductase [Flavisolibacter sp.]|nr:NAD(P)-dependent oxidoreductase [Flavisolibacter sp.]MBD0295027.1 NAD(P)-dependent oxidoreductase [Flavisolibacter sp.]MBD0365928.1 NAD(P)-dependent oxidoreductase [Flavisolibacter sp.]MBD0376623.1 NAD(P)-dependent oxidoreductase [Flavisolibacter sp.]
MNDESDNTVPPISPSTGGGRGEAFPSGAGRQGTVLITGGSRGIGKAIALRMAQAGYNIVIAAKTVEPHPKLEGTIYTAAQEIEALGVQCLPLPCDIRYEDQIEKAVEETINTFGRIDILVNNASAISLTPTEQTEAKRFDLMHGINVRGTFFVCKACIPHLKKASNPHILNLSPPLNLNPKWFAQHLAYTMSKYGMSMMVLGLSEELKKYKIGVNALWPKTTIATAAVQNLLGGDEMMQRSRKPEIVADAAYAIIKKASAVCTGNFFIDEDVLRHEGVTDFEKYAVNSQQELMTDIFLDEPPEEKI